MQQAPTIVWFRRDLRVEDHPALAAADGPVVALYVVDPAIGGGELHRRPRWAAAVTALDDALATRGGRLRVEVGAPAEVVGRVVAETGARAVQATADHSPFARGRDAAVEAALDVPFRRWWANLVLPPGAVLVDDDHVPLVFSAFHRRWAATDRDPWPEQTDELTVLDDPGQGLDAIPQGAGRDGTEEAHARLTEFLERVDDYAATRDLPAERGTSGLSADLRFGTISPRRVVDEVGNHTPGRAAFVRQLAWRDWYAHLLG